MSQFANLEANSVVAVIQDYRRASRVMFALILGPLVLWTGLAWGLSLTPSCAGHWLARGLEAAQVPESWTQSLTQLENGACDPWWLYALLGALGVAAVGFSGFVSWLLWMIFKGVFEPMTLPCYEIVWVRPDAWLAERAAPQVQTRLYGNLTAVQPAGGFVERFLQTSPTLLSLLPRCLVGERMALLRVLFVGRMGNRCFQYGFGRLRAAFLDLSFEAPPVDRPFDSLPARVRSRGLPLLLVPGSGWLRLPARFLFNFVEAFFIVWGTLLGLPRPTIPIGLPGESEGEHPGFAVRRGVPESAAWPVVEDDDASHDQAVLEGVREDVPHPWLPLFDPTKADGDGGAANGVKGEADAADGEDRDSRRRAGARPVSRSRSRSRSGSRPASRPREVEVRRRRGRSTSASRRDAVQESGLHAPDTLETSAAPVPPSSRSRASSEGGVVLDRAHGWASPIAFPTHEFLPLTAAERAHWLSVPYSRYVQELAMLAGPRGVLLPMVRRWFLRTIEVAVQRRVAAQSPAVVPLEPDDVVMHVRLGDILTGWHAAYRPLPLSFYRAALQHFEATGAPIRRVVLVGEHGDKYNILRTMADKLRAERGCEVLLQSASAEDDFLSLLLAPRLVMSISTFAWWAAFLGHGEVFYPRWGMLSRCVVDVGFAAPIVQDLELGAAFRTHVHDVMALPRWRGMEGIEQLWD